MVMGEYGSTVQRPVAATPRSSNSSDSEETKQNSPRTLHTLTFSFPFNVPSTPESAAARIIKNLERLALFYATFMWTVLFITLIPKRKVSIVYLVATTEVGFLYCLLLRCLPNFAFLRMLKPLVFLVVFVGIVVEMILTRAGIHFFVSLTSTIPVVILHAVLCKTEGACMNWDYAELSPLVSEKDVRQKASENFV